MIYYERSRQPQTITIYCVNDADNEMLRSALVQPSHHFNRIYVSSNKPNVNETSLLAAS